MRAVTERASWTGIVSTVRAVFIFANIGHHAATGHECVVKHGIKTVPEEEGRGRPDHVGVFSMLCPTHKHESPSHRWRASRRTRKYYGKHMILNLGITAVRGGMYKHASPVVPSCKKTS